MYTGKMIVVKMNIGYNRIVQIFPYNLLMHANKIPSREIQTKGPGALTLCLNWRPSTQEYFEIFFFCE